MKIPAALTDLINRLAPPEPSRFAVNHGQRATAELDGLLLWPALGLLLFGLVMVYSASIAMAEGSKFTNYSSS